MSLQQFMKRYLSILSILILLLLSACGQEPQEDLEPTESVAVQDSLDIVRGEFIYLSDAAVLKGEDFIYGVHMDSISLDLAEKIEKYKKEDFDMVPVVVKGKIVTNPKNDGWDDIIEIRELMEIQSENPASVQKSSEK